MPVSANELLIRLLRVEVETARAETDALINSLRYRLGDLLLQALPISWRSFQIFPRVYALFSTYRRNVRGRVGVAATRSAMVSLSATALRCNSIEFTQAAADTSLHNDVWSTNDSDLLVARLDMAPVSQLILRDISEPIARRLGRLQLQGCQIIWWPSLPEAVDPLQRYVQSLADECRYGVFS